MKQSIRKILLTATILASFVVLLNRLVWLFDRLMNTVRIQPPYPIRPEVERLHQSLFVADLHADTLLWNRNFLQKNKRGQVDLPRLVEGNVSLQVFGVVTKTPWGLNFASNPADSDMLPLLVMPQLWPMRTWGNLIERALFQAEKLGKFARQSNGKLIFVRCQADLDSLFTRRESGEKVVGGFPSLEGVHALEGRLENLDRLYAAGFRMIGLTHFFDNEAIGSAHGEVRYGLTPFGKELVQRIQEKKMILDLAHTCPLGIDEVLDITTGPVIVSHTGVRGTCDNQRNLSDDHIRQIAASGGVIGIAMFDTAVCGKTSLDVAWAIRYVTDLVGVEHAALGSDYDGLITAPFDASGMALLTQDLVDIGFNEADIRKIMGENFLRVLREVME